MRSRNSLKLAGLVTAVAVFSAVTAIGLSERPNVELSQQRNLEVPNFSSESLISGEMISKQLLKSDRYKLLNVWASWCGICRREH